MEISNETATSLGNKLAALDLTQAEALLLTAALADADQDVSGFSGTPDIAGFEKAAPKLIPLVQGPINDRWKDTGGTELWKSDGTALWKV